MAVSLIPDAAIAATIAPELAPANADGTIPVSLTADRNPACAKNPKKPEEKATPILQLRAGKPWIIDHNLSNCAVRPWGSLSKSHNNMDQKRPATAP